MATIPVNEVCFQHLIDRMNQSHSPKEKFELFYYSPGFYSGLQAAVLLSCFKTAPEKHRVIKVLEKKLCRMSCAEAREILHSFAVTDTDRIVALDCVKRTLTDHHSTEGMEYILSAFEYERDKMQALGILQTVSTYVTDKLAAGGHQGYAAMGGLYTQNWPLEEHLFGPLEDQIKRMPGRGEPCMHPSAMPGQKPSFYSSHPSYAYSADVAVDTIRGYPGARPFPDPCHPEESCPMGAPPISFNQGCPAPTGFANMTQ